VPDDQPRLTILFFNYPDESDLDGGAFPNGLYPIPPTMPVEGWPKATGDPTLEEWQQDVNDTGGDRHAIIVAPGAGSIWETWLARLTISGWEASDGAKFDLNSNASRPTRWTLGDAAGRPMFAALVRYDECERGMVEHALRVVVAQTRREYIYPANHYASSIPATSINYPAMGPRFRLKASFGTDDAVMIGAVIVTGIDPATILFRALGPSLASFGIQNPLPDPTLDLFDAQGTQIATDDDWKDSQQAAI
jgi:hypothetical protein